MGSYICQYDALLLDYDQRGLLTKELNNAGSFTHQYDPLGALLETELPDGRHLNHLYYGSGHLLQTNLEDKDRRHVLANFERDHLHREVNRSQGSLTHYTRYDSIGRTTVKMTKQTHLSDLFAPVIDKHFSYDKADNLTKRSVSYGEQTKPHQFGASDFTQLYYDEIDQIIGHYTKAQERVYQYDKAANVMAEQSHSKEQQTANAIKHNRVLGYKNMHYSYDGFGRMLTREGHSGSEKQRFEYDSEHRLIKVELLNHPSIHFVEFKYDVIGRRTQKIVHHKEETQADQTTDFWWSGMQMVAEVDKAQKWSCVYVYNDHSYEPLARVERYNDDPKTDQVSYFHTHINGAPEELTDEEGQII